jgi:carboxymethylenebutenolidase
MDRRTDVTVADGTMPGYVWLPPAGTGPGILLLQEVFGVSRYIRQRAADLAAAGYVVLAPELYWRLAETSVEESSPTALADAMGLVSQLDWPTTVADAVAAFDRLRKLDEVRGRVGVVGFCFGGGLAYNVAAVASPDVLVSYYGSALPDLLHLAPNVSAASLHHFGLDDEYIDNAAVERIRAAVTSAPGGPVRFETYQGANHAFDNPDFVLHHPQASALAWQRTLSFLAEHLPVAAPTG